MKIEKISKDASTTFVFCRAAPLPPEAPTGRLRTKPRTRCASCCATGTRPPGAPCRRSVWRRHSSVPCGGTRGTDPCSGAAALRCTNSAVASRRCAVRCSRTRRSSQRCSARRRWIQTWRRMTGSRRSSASGCGRASANAGRAPVEGWDTKEVAKFSFFCTGHIGHISIQSIQEPFFFTFFLVHTCHLLLLYFFGR